MLRPPVQIVFCKALEHLRMKALMNPSQVSNRHFVDREPTHERAPFGLIFEIDRRASMDSEATPGPVNSIAAFNTSSWL